MAIADYLTRWSPALSRDPDMVIEELMQAMELRLSSGLVERQVEQPEAWDGSFTGYATTSDPDHDSWVVPNGAYTESMGTYMRNPVGLFNHDPALPIFSTKGFEEREAGLHIHGGMDLLDSFANEKAGQLRRGILRGLSIGFLPRAEPKILDGKLVFSQIQILEISLVSVPANPHALIDKKAAERIERWTGSASRSFAFAPEPEPAAITFSDDVRLRRIVAEMIDVRLGELHERRSRYLMEALESFAGAVRAEDS